LVLAEVWLKFDTLTLRGVYTIEFLGPEYGIDREADVAYFGGHVADCDLSGEMVMLKRNKR